MAGRATSWPDLLRRWEAQQERYLPARDERNHSAIMPIGFHAETLSIAGFDEVARHGATSATRYSSPSADSASSGCRI